jgi:hypothetical protein
MYIPSSLILILMMLLVPTRAFAGDTNRLAYLDEDNPYYPGRDFPKLSTPQWIGEPGVEAAIILAIDDMTAHEKYEVYLRPILRRLQQIDGRAPVSIMTNRINPMERHLQDWLHQGLSLETHTFDHPCPLLAGGNLARARLNYERCVDILSSVPNSKPVAFRMPCCDSLNTVSPCFFTEIFNQTSSRGNFLTLDSSVFNIFTSNDPALPRNLVIDPDGRDRFLKYRPDDRSFVNTIENYPYPYVISRLCWEFPCVMPSDWEGFHFYKQPCSAALVRDLEAAIDATVIKRGVMNVVFHPHGWIKNTQIVELIDHAVARYGNKIKFLTFREAQDRLNRNLLDGEPLRNAHGQDNGVRLLDVNGDGYMDVIVGNEKRCFTRVWTPGANRVHTSSFPIPLAEDGKDQGAHFGVLQPDGHASLLVRNDHSQGLWSFGDKDWVEVKNGLGGLEMDGKPIETNLHGTDAGVRLRAIDHDGPCELVIGNPRQQAVFSWSQKSGAWTRLPFCLPDGATIVNADGRDNGLRFVDIDEDGREDILLSNEEGYGLYLFNSRTEGWSRRALSGKGSERGEFPLISRRGRNNGTWFHSRQFWVQNENTALLKDHVDRRSFNELLRNVEPAAKSPLASLHAIRTRPGFTVELVAAEPLVEDPVAFDWGPDGRLWVVEMRDYPLGVDGKGKPGGRIKVLEDTHGDGKYDKATIFLDNIGFPTGIKVWGKGVIVTCAPEIFYAEDTDGDGKADVRRPLFLGFQEGNQQHRVNGPVWGLDNWVYCANGESGGVVRSVKTGKTVDIRGRDVRLRPDEGLVEAETGVTQFGRSRDDWGNWFGNNNSDPLYHYVLMDRYLRRNPHVAAPDSRVQVSVTPGASPVYPVSRTLPRFNDLWAADHFTSVLHSPITHLSASRSIISSIAKSCRPGATRLRATAPLMKNARNSWLPATTGSAPPA